MTDTHGDKPSESLLMARLADMRVFAKAGGLGPFRERDVQELIDALSARSAGGLIPQGPCETTQTPRFQIADCACGTYKGNLGPCLTWWQGNSGRCVYCEHGLDCHVKLSKLLTPSEKRQDDPKNANLAALVLKLDKHISLHEMFAPEWEAVVAAARATPQSASERTDDYKSLYHELLFAVARKFPDETRHQTALRYIQRAETPSNDPPKEAK